MTKGISATCAIAVMAKAPQPGRSKTRLVPAVTPEQAASLSAAFLRDITENITAAGGEGAIDGLVAYAPAGLERLFDGHLADDIELILADGNANMPPRVEGFGRCLLHAVKSMLAAGYNSAIVLNSDSPTLPTSILAYAAKILGEPGDRAVLGPAEDGGYYLLGMKAEHAHLFTDIEWSTANVASQTALRASEIGLDLVTLPVWYDVDDEASLGRLIGDLCGTAWIGTKELVPYPAPATAACLAKLGLAHQDGVRQRA